MHRLAFAFLFLLLTVDAVRAQTTRELDAWLRQQRLVAVQPPRPGIEPGQLVRLDGAALVPIADGVEPSRDSRNERDPALPHQISVRRSFFRRFFLGDDRRTRSLAEVASIRLKLDGLRRSTAKLAELEQLIRADAKLVASIAKAKHPVFVVSEVLSVDALRLVPYGSDGAEIREPARIRKIAQALGQNSAELVGAGVQFAQRAVIGCRVVPVRADGGVLGSDGVEIVVDDVGIAAIEHEMRLSAKPVADVYSGFQVCSLAIGLGNYGAGELRPLGGGPESARVYGDTIAAALAPASRHLSRVHTSRMIEGGFQRDAPVTRQQIEQWVSEFVEDMQTVLDPRLETVVCLYYFGHGFVEEFSHSPMIAAEDFEPGGRDSDEFVEDLLPLATVADELGRLSDRVVVFADMCREHDFEDERLLAWMRHAALDASALAALTEDLRKIAAAVGGLYGPHVLLFGDRNGASATPLVARDLSTRRIGPLAVRFARLMQSVRAGASFDLGEFLAAMETPLASPEDEYGVRAFTALRDSIRRQLPPAVLWTKEVKRAQARAEPWPFAPADRPFEAIIEEASNPAPAGREPAIAGQAPEDPTLVLTRSGVRVHREAPGPFPELADFCYAPTLGVGYLLQRDGSLWRHDRNAATVATIGQAGAAELGVTGTGEVFIHDASLRDIERREDDQWRGVVQDVRVLGFDESYDGGSVLVRIRAGNGFALARLVPGSIDTVMTTEDPAVLDVVEIAEEVFVLSRRDAELIVVDGQTQRVPLPDGRAERLTRWGDTVYGVTASGRHLYRLRRGQRLEVLSLFAPEHAERFARKAGLGGFQATGASELLILAGNAVWRLDLADAKWSPTR